MLAAEFRADVCPRHFVNVVDAVRLCRHEAFGGVPPSRRQAMPHLVQHVTGGEAAARLRADLDIPRSHDGARRIAQSVGDAALRLAFAVHNAGNEADRDASLAGAHVTRQGLAPFEGGVLHQLGDAQLGGEDDLAHGSWSLRGRWRLSVGSATRTARQHQECHTQFHPLSVTTGGDAASVPNQCNSLGITGEYE